jgi:hypothetical protein
MGAVTADAVDQLVERRVEDVGEVRRGVPGIEGCATPRSRRITRQPARFRR